ncbi:PA2169 family four-helix-bundle protein [Variovorax paradoxus]|nr:PA2169 family four-helix-bundle protein [Variovorax paradoxus]MBT2305163.1 PA2169 family four-helix-bundle protein [Variovorax paradoxus]
MAEIKGDKEPHPSNELNEDPLTGEPGAHPVGTGLGATAGAVAGAAAGAVVGPVGVLVGLIAGGIAGGLGGKAVAENVNPTVEEAYWREHYAGESYYEAGRGFEDYGPAYELGWSSRAVRGDVEFDTAEPALAEEWKVRRGSSGLEWEQAQPATRAAWDRAESAYFRTGNPDASPDPEGVLDKDRLADVLNHLLEAARDDEFGFQTCANEVAAPDLQQEFYECAEQCRQAADQLVQMIRRYGGTPAEQGPVGAAVQHRGWVHVKGVLGEHDDLSMLEECARAGGATLLRYRQVLEQNLPAKIHDFAKRQTEGSQRHRDRIQDLRNHAACAR